jgi:uroporphyrinogen decarboxylase
MERTSNCLEKLARMNAALSHQEPDRVPVSDFFWGSFLKCWREEFDLPADADIYRYYNLDWMQFNPNVDPHIKPFEILKDSPEEVVVRTGFEAVLFKKFDQAMPAFLSFDTDTIDKMKAFEFDDPWDTRRYFSAGDDQINGVGDSFARNLPSFVDRVNAAWTDFPVFGGVCEAHEMMWRIIGSENTMCWMGMYPDEIAHFAHRINEYALEVVKAQIKAADGHLDGLVIWGDVAYKKGMMFSPAFWRSHFKPGVRALIDECHSHGLPVIYHGCGNVNRIFEDFVEIGVDAYNPLEFKAGMDAIDLRRRFGHRIGFCGNMDVQLWAAGSREELKAAVLTKLNAAKGGGFIFQSDHSVPGNVSPASYEYVVQLVREHGRYPLQLGEYDIPEFDEMVSG